MIKSGFSLTAIAAKTEEWRQKKEAILSGDVVPSTSTGEEENIYNVKDEEVGIWRNVDLGKTEK